MVTAANSPSSLVRAHLKGARMSPYKVRLVADQIRGMRVADALDLLAFSPRKAAAILNKLLRSAIANAENNRELDSDALYISELRVNEAATMKRIKPRARGRADRFFRRSCHISLYLGQAE